MADSGSKKPNSTSVPLDFDDINFPVDNSSAQSKPSAPVVKTVNPTPSTAAAPATTGSSTISSLRAKMSAAAAEYRPSQASAAYTEYTPSKVQLPSSMGTSAAAGADFDPNHFNPLTGSGAFPTDLDVGDEDYEFSDPESDDVASDDDSRDLCSNPCVSCGAVPSYVVYELCANCLDKIGPQ